MEACDDWHYRSEGNCNIVIYNKKLGRVYRMLKVAPNTQWNDENKKDSEDYSDIQEHYSKLIQFGACVMDRLYNNYMSVPLMQSVDVEFLKKLALSIEDKRPDKRLAKSLSLCPTVLDIPDFAFLPVPYHNYARPSFMFELKAGCVARSFRNMIPETQHSAIPRCTVSNSYCYFCLNKSILCSNTQKRISRYCPQELFSGNTRRMRKCLTSLLEDINRPRNKLRIFQNGVDITPHLGGADDIKSVFSSHVSPKSEGNILKELVDILMGCLTHSNLGFNRRGSIPVISRSAKSEFVNSLKLPEGCALYLFANAQLYGASTVEEILTAYDELRLAIVRNPEVGKLLCIDGPYDTGMWRLSARPDNPPGISDHIMSAYILVRNYLIFRTAKDSSILVTFQPLSENDAMSQTGDDETVFTVTDSTGYNKYQCKVSVIDFDLKPFSRMEKYLDSDWRIYNALQKQLF